MNVEEKGYSYENMTKRTAMLVGTEAVERLKNSHVAVFGIGGVGGYAVEALARSGVGALTLFDNDVVSESNINRQIIALYSSVGRYKTEAMRDRILDINPEAEVFINNVFYLPENADEFDLSEYDYIIDAVDTVSAKIEIITRAYRAGIPVISAMGAGNKLDPSKLEVTDIYNTRECPLARVMRRELRKRGVERLKVVYSTEKARRPLPLCEKDDGGLKPVPGSVAFVPSVAGLMLAAEAFKDIIGV